VANKGVWDLMVKYCNHCGQKIPKTRDVCETCVNNVIKQGGKLMNQKYVDDFSDDDKIQTELNLWNKEETESFDRCSCSGRARKLWTTNCC